MHLRINNGISPTQNEIADHIGIRTSGISRYLKMLQIEGVIQIEDGKYRSIKVLKWTNKHVSTDQERNALAAQVKALSNKIVSMAAGSQQENEKTLSQIIASYGGLQYLIGLAEADNNGYCILTDHMNVADISMKLSKIVNICAKAKIPEEDLRAVIRIVTQIRNGIGLKPRD